MNDWKHSTDPAEDIYQSFLEYVVGWMSVSKISATSLRYDLDKFNLMLRRNNIALVVINMPIYSIPCVKNTNVL